MNTTQSQDRGDRDFLRTYLQGRIGYHRTLRDRPEQHERRIWDMDGAIAGYEEALSYLNNGLNEPHHTVREHFVDHIRDMAAHWSTAASEPGLSLANQIKRRSMSRAEYQTLVALRLQFPSRYPALGLSVTGSQGPGHVGPMYNEPAAEGYSVRGDTETEDWSDGNTITWTDAFNRPHRVELFDRESVRVFFPIPVDGNWVWHDDDRENTGFRTGTRWVSAQISFSENNLRIIAVGYTRNGEAITSGHLEQGVEVFESLKPMLDWFADNATGKKDAITAIVSGGD